MNLTKKMAAIGSSVYLALDCLLITTDMYELLRGLFA